MLVYQHRKRTRYEKLFTNNDFESRRDSKLISPLASIFAQKPISYAKKGLEPKLSSKQKLLLKIKEGKETTQSNASLTWWKARLLTLFKLSLVDQVASLKGLLRSPKMQDPPLALEMRIFRVQLEFQLWLQEPDRGSGATRDRYTVSIMRLLKEICDANFMTSSAKKVLTAMFKALGFTNYVSSNTSVFSAPEVEPDRPLSFSAIDLINSKNNKPYYEFMLIVEHPIIWQLRLFGEYMDRSMDSAPDKRVAFQPDAWQRQVLDCIDKDHSLLVVGKFRSKSPLINILNLRSTDECRKDIYFVLCDGKDIKRIGR